MTALTVFTAFLILIGLFAAAGGFEGRRARKAWEARMAEEREAERERVEREEAERQREMEARWDQALASRPYTDEDIAFAIDGPTPEEYWGRERSVA